jgi:hypothetical protein
MHRAPVVVVVFEVPHTRPGVQLLGQKMFWMIKPRQLLLLILQLPNTKKLQPPQLLNTNVVQPLKVLKPQELKLKPQPLKPPKPHELKLKPQPPTQPATLPQAPPKPNPPIEVQPRLVGIEATHWPPAGTLATVVVATGRVTTAVVAAVVVVPTLTLMLPALDPPPPERFPGLRIRVDTSGVPVPPERVIVYLLFWAQVELQLKVALLPLVVQVASLALAAQAVTVAPGSLTVTMNEPPALTV